jgi:DNA polymerase III epsilon subunit-like protein
MPILVFDTETTGLPIRKGWKFYPPSNLSKSELSRLVQISMLVCEGDDVLETHDYIIKPSYDFKVINSHIHGITHEQAELEGTTLDDVFQLLEKLLTKYNFDEVVCHNVAFDKYILSSELIRSNNQQLEKKFNKIRTYCTMVNHQYLGKWQKLDELYIRTMGRPRVESEKHNSLHDARDTFECYRRLRLK